MSEGQIPNEVPTPERGQQNPTEESNSFLRDWGIKVRGAIDIATDVSKKGIFTGLASAGAIVALGGINPLPDIAEGRWGRLAAKGVLAGILVSPIARFLTTPKTANVDE